MDVLQIPAFLCRQTDLLLAAGRTGRAINIKKGQFLAPWDMANIVAKFDAVGNRNLLLCERGASFGYNTLVSDMRSLPIMARTGCPIVFDATHSVQQPGGLGEKSGGQREFVPVLARAAVAIGVAAVFIETHQDPDHAPSDGPNMIALKNLAGLLTLLQEIDIIAKANPIEMPVVYLKEGVNNSQIASSSQVKGGPFENLPNCRSNWLQMSDRGNPDNYLIWITRRFARVMTKKRIDSARCRT